MIFTGSREWGEPNRSSSQHEQVISTAAVSRLVARHVIGLTEKFGTRNRAAAKTGGLVIIQGGAPGADTRVANATRIFGSGLRRRTRAELRRMFVEPELADGLWLETYMADWKNRPRHLAGPERNQLMLDQGADHVIALFAHERVYGPDERGGTNDMVRRAVAAGVPVDIYVAAERRWRKP